jgi:hypothetical protein
VQAPAESQVSKRNTRGDANFAGVFWFFWGVIRVYKYEKWHFPLFSSKNEVCKYEKALHVCIKGLNTVIHCYCKPYTTEWPPCSGS